MAQFLRIRILSDQGTYPSYEVATDRYLIDSLDGRLWYMVICDSYEETNENEISWCVRDELRFLAALMMVSPDPFSKGYLCPIPLAWPIGSRSPFPNFGRPPFDLHDQTLRETIEHELRREFQRVPKEPDGPRQLGQCAVGSLDEIDALFKGIDATDELLMRGLSLMVKAQMLLRQTYGAYLFMEEAALLGMIAIEAALRFIQGNLKLSTGSGTVADALDYIGEVFHVREPLIERIREFQGLQTTVGHPLTRWGEMWLPPLDADDCYEAAKLPMMLFRYIVTGKRPPKYWG